MFKNKESKPEQSIGGHYESTERRAGLARLAMQVLFESTMQEADERLITRDEALARISLMAAKGNFTGEDDA